MNTSEFKKYSNVFLCIIKHNSIFSWIDNKKLSQINYKYSIKKAQEKKVLYTDDDSERNYQADSR